MHHHRDRSSAWRRRLAGLLAQVLVLQPLVPGLALAGPDDLVLVDLQRLGPAVSLAVATGARVVGFAPHVAEDLLEQATHAGAEALPRSIFFRRLGEGI